MNSDPVGHAPEHHPRVLLRSVAHNQARGVKNIQLYEQGHGVLRYEGKKQPKERRRLAGVMAGAFGDAAWNAQPAAFDFFDGKGIVESLLHELATPKVRFKALSAEEAPHLQPGRAAQVLSGGTVLGWVGEIHPLAADAFEATAPVVAFELDLDALVKTSQPARDYVDVPLFPAVTMDIALVVDEDVTNEKLMQVMRSAGGQAALEHPALRCVSRRRAFGRGQEIDGLCARISLARQDAYR